MYRKTRGVDQHTLKALAVLRIDAKTIYEFGARIRNKSTTKPEAKHRKISMHTVENANAVRDAVSCQSESRTRALLLEQPDLAFAPDEHGRFLFHYACMGDNEYLTQFVLDQNPDVLRVPDTCREYFPLHYACIAGAAETVQMILHRDRRAMYDWTLFEWELPLHLACREGHAEVVRVLIEADTKKRSLVQKDEEDRIPLLRACESGKESVVRLLLHDEALEVLKCGVQCKHATCWRGAVHRARYCGTASMVALLQSYFAPLRYAERSLKAGAM